MKDEDARFSSNGDGGGRAVVGGEAVFGREQIRFPDGFPGDGHLDIHAFDGFLARDERDRLFGDGDPAVW